MKIRGMDHETRQSIAAATQHKTISYFGLCDQLSWTYIHKNL